MSKPYRPSNGSEGSVFMEHFCYHCKKDVNQDCPLVSASMGYNIDEPGYPVEWIVDDDGLSNPRCTAFDPLPRGA